MAAERIFVGSAEGGGSGGSEPGKAAASWSTWQQDRMQSIRSAFCGTEFLHRQPLVGAIAKCVRDAVASGDAAALLLLDINAFSDVNAAWGLATGDEVLSAVAGRLADYAAERGPAAGAGSSIQVGWLDADHFAAVIAGAPSPDLLRKSAEELVEIVAQPLHLRDRTIHVSGRVAIVQIPVHGRSVTSVLGRGFRLLNTVARGRPKGVALSEPEAESSHGIAMLERDLAAALTGTDLFIALQPKYGLASGRVEGAEALVRWRHPQHGMLPPPVFIEVAERSGLIFDLGLRVLSDSCKAARSLAAIGGKLDIAVNVSPLQLAHPDFLSRFLEVIDRECVEPSTLQIELTETAATMGGDDVGGALQSLRHCGIGIAIDDFGTGFSNLASLAALPADTLKIDRSLVVGWQSGAKASALLDVAVHLGRTFGMRTVAEGVETQEQYEHVKEIGCDLVQGYLTGRPVPSDEFAARYMR